MKIWCDVCDKEEAIVFCSADEAALCEDCDRRVHHANKLASKHSRFSLLRSLKESPLCDICQERRAFLFCQEDRAIFCRECDLSIHKANENTQKHNRLLLTGVKLSSSTTSPSLNPTSSSSNGNIATIDSEAKSSSSQYSKRFRLSVSNNENPSSPSIENPLASSSTSNVSDYLMESLPSWHMDDFPEPTGGGANGFCKIFKLFLPGKGGVSETIIGSVFVN